MFNPDTGSIRVTDSLEKCAAAARPDVDPAYQNHCVECLPECMDKDASVTYTIPVTPLRADHQASIRRSGAGLALNGVKLEGPAPVDAILGNYTIAPFDDCGGHVNLHVGYHYHAATDCLDEVAMVAWDSRIIGIAMDGYLIHSCLKNDGTPASNLDGCGGHKTDDQPYHSHAGEPGSNAILNCLGAEFGCASENPGVFCDASTTRCH